MINYYLITKPKIILGNLVTVAAGFLLASHGHFYLGLFTATLAGIAFIMAAACVFNNYIDRNLDKEMERTKQRAIASGLISEQSALFFGTALGFLGIAILFFFTNMLTAVVATIGFFVYVVPYSMWKRHTIYGTAIGSIAGAVPPVVGYCAVSNRFDLGALVFFVMMILWQMPHFFAIALYHFEDYRKAKIPVVPIVKGAERAKIHMTIYIVGFVIATMLLTFFNYTGYVYLVVATGMSLLWLWICLKGFQSRDDKKWGQTMFRVSLIAITAICFIIPFDTISI